MNLSRSAKPEKKIFARQMRKRPTRYEELLWTRLKCKRFFGMRWHRQKVIRGYIVDFYCPTLKVAVEVDGPIHDPQKDAVRDAQIYRGTKIRVLRFSNEAVQNKIGEVIDFIAVESGVRTFPTNPQAQQQQVRGIGNGLDGGSCVCVNVEKFPKPLPALDIEEIPCEKIVSSSWMTREPCPHQVFTNAEVAQTTMRMLQSKGITWGRIGKCRQCGKIHIHIEPQENT